MEKESKEYEQTRTKSNRLSLEACKKALNDDVELEEKKIEETIQEIIRLMRHRNTLRLGNA